MALRRVAEIVDFIARDRPDTATDWVSGLFDLVTPLKDFPDRSRVVPELARPAIRELIYGEYRVVYRVRASVVEILTVRHGRQRFEISERRGRWVARHKS